MTNTQRIKVFKIVLVSLIILFVMLLIGLIANLVRLAAVRTQKDELDKLNDYLSMQIEQVQQEIDYRSTDEYINRYAREFLGMIGADEISIATEK